MEAKLIVIGGKANKSEIKLKLPTTIGRSRKADLTIAHPKVSRQHCQIFERDGVLIVRDNGSLNGTLIDNDRITEAILKPGDKLTVGPLTFVAVYEHSGALPPLTDDLETPDIGAIELPPALAKVGRGGSKPVVATPIKPAAPPPPAPPPELKESEVPDFSEPPQPATIAATEPTPEAEDFSWLTGEPPAPSAGSKSTSPPIAQTVTMKLPPEPEREPLNLAAPLETPAQDAPIAAEPAEDFSWLDNAEAPSVDEVDEPPLDLSSFEATEPEEEPVPPPTPVVKPSSDRTLVQEQGPTVVVPTKDLIEPVEPAIAAPEEVSEAEEAEAEEPGVPDFSAMPTSQPAPAENSEHSSSSVARKGADKKAWWSFGGKKKPSPAKPVPAAQPEEPSEPAEDVSPAEPPQFVMPAEPAAEEKPAAEPAADEDEALSEFFKKLQ